MLLHLFFWAITSWVLLYSFSIETRDIQIINGVKTVTITHNPALVKQLSVALFFSFVLFYFNSRIISGVKVGENTLRTILQSLLILSIILLACFSVNHWMTGTTVRLPAVLIASSVSFYYMTSVALGIGKAWWQAESQKQQALLEKKQAELSLLRAQLHPHFLFNVLNNLLSMVDQAKNPVLATSIDRLSTLLRYVVYETAQEKVPVSREIEFIRNYAELQLLRFEPNEIDFSIEVTGDYDQQPVAPGLFIPFVENAFKYGVAPEQQSDIRLHFNLTSNDSIIFESSNPIMHPSPVNEESGAGIVSVKKRLQLIYPNRHQLSISDNDSYDVHLELNTHEGNHH